MSCRIFVLFPNEIPDEPFHNESTFTILVNKIALTLNIVKIFIFILILFLLIINTAALIFLKLWFSLFSFKMDCYSLGLAHCGMKFR